MDTSVTSIDAMAREFGETLFQRGFSKGIFHEFSPYQTTDVLLTTHALIGLVLNGELLFQFQDCLIINGIGDQFFVPANTHYQITAGQEGAQFLLAKHCNSAAAIVWEADQKLGNHLRNEMTSSSPSSRPI